MNKYIFAGIFILLVDNVTFADPEYMQPYVGSPQFENMKKLAGTWWGTSSTGKEGERVTVKYEIKSAGSAVVETLFLGTPHEMISVYYD